MKIAFRIFSILSMIAMFVFFNNVFVGWLDNFEKTTLNYILAIFIVFGFPVISTTLIYLAFFGAKSKNVS